MRNPLKVGVVGCGRWGKNIVRTLTELADRLPVALDKVLHTGNAGRRAAVENITNATFCTQPDAFFANLDAVIIASPDPTHFDLARRALVEGKHVLVEKPIAENLSQAGELIRLSREKGLVLMTGHVLLYSQALDYVVRALADTGEKPVGIFSSRHGAFELGEGRTLHRSVLIHDISRVDYLLRELPGTVWVGGFGMAGHTREYQDICLLYPGDVFVNLSGSSLSPMAERLFKIWTRSRLVRIDEEANSGRVFRRTAEGWEPVHEASFSDRPLTREIEDFLEAVIRRRPPRVDSGHIERVMETLEKIEAAWRS